MRPLVRGSHIPLITKGEFEQLTLDVPPLETQRLIESIDALHRRENTLIRSLQEKRSQLIGALCTKASKRAQSGKKG
jgi:restriction endonuclease S subunit